MKRRPPASPKRPSEGSGREKTTRRVVAASDFKAHCLRILDEVAQGEEVLVTKRGVEIAVVSPVTKPQTTTSRGSWKGSVEITGDIVHGDWSEDFEASR